MSIFSWMISRPDRTPQSPSHGVNPKLTLADIPPGGDATILGFLPAMPATRRSQLQAYGLLPGLSIRVLQQTPVTIIRIEYTELAIEVDLAQQIEVQT